MKANDLKIEYVPVNPGMVQVAQKPYDMRVVHVPTGITVTIPDGIGRTQHCKLQTAKRMIGMAVEYDRKVDNEAEELLDVLADLARMQFSDDGGRANSMCSSTGAEALRLLARHGRVEIEKEAGRAVVGRWIEDGATECADQGDGNVEMMGIERLHVHGQLPARA
jgi:hypothetical protein